MAINFNNLPTEKASQFTVIPKGCYVAKIVKSEMKTPKSGNADYFSAECDITDPASGNPMGKFWINLFDSQANLCLYQIRRFIEAIGLKIEGEFELKDLTKMVNGKSLAIDICPDEKGERSIVDISAGCFYPLGSSEREKVDEEIADTFNKPIATPEAEPVPQRASSY